MWQCVEFCPARRWHRLAILVAALVLTGCALVAPYDSYFDQSLNKLSDDTAKFLAAAGASGPERQATSKEAVAYYATTYNLLDRLSQRARLSRGGVACTTNPILKVYWANTPSTGSLPEDYESFDCREFDLYSVRHFVDQLHFVHGQPGGLNPGRIRADGGVLQTAIMGAIQTFIASKPQSGKGG